MSNSSLYDHYIHILTMVHHNQWADEMIWENRHDLEEAIKYFANPEDISRVHSRIRAKIDKVISERSKKLTEICK